MTSFIITVLIIVASAFFVVIEFSTMGARRNRLEESAETSRSARAGLRSLNELTVMLAGAQLGITAATLALGAVTKPWVHEMLTPILEALNFPATVADIAAFVLALFIVTFLHLVVGEMAPKSWAIAHPEKSLQMVAPLARGWVWIFRPLLSWVNSAANRMVKMTGEKPVDRAAAAGYDAETLRTLVEHSRETGALDDASATQITGVIELEASTAKALATKVGAETVPLPADASVAEMQQFAAEKNNMRVLVRSRGPEGLGVVHVRDTLLADPGTPLNELTRPVLKVAGSTTVQDTLDRMRARNEQLAVVGKSGKDNAVWTLTWDDIMGQLWPQIAEELDRAVDKSSNVQRK